MEPEVKAITAGQRVREFLTAPDIVEKVRKVIEEHRMSTHISKQDALDQIARLVGLD